MPGAFWIWSAGMRQELLHIRRVVDVDIPHPRSMADPRAVAFKDAILHELGVIAD